MIFLLGLCLIAAVVMSRSTLAQERSSIALSSNPDEWPAQWPDDLPRPTDLSDIEGTLNIEVYPEGTEFSVDFWGTYDGSGKDYLAAYHDVLVAAGFEQVDRNEGSDTINANYQRGVERLTIGSDVVNTGALLEYTEIGVVYYGSVPTAQ
jgi:hypothetical protein